MGEQGQYEAICLIDASDISRQYRKEAIFSSETFLAYTKANPPDMDQSDGIRRCFQFHPIPVIITIVHYSIPCWRNCIHL